MKPWNIARLQRELTAWQRWILRRICRQLVRQGIHHADRIEAYYRLMYDAAENEFSEDNYPTLTGFLRERHESAMRRDIVDSESAGRG